MIPLKVQKRPHKGAVWLGRAEIGPRKGGAGAKMGRRKREKGGERKGKGHVLCASGA